MINLFALKHGPRFVKEKILSNCVIKYCFCMICQNLDSKNEHWASQWEIKMIIDLKSKLPITMTEYRNKSDSKSSRHEKIYDYKDIIRSFFHCISSLSLKCQKEQYLIVFTLSKSKSSTLESSWMNSTSSTLYRGSSFPKSSASSSSATSTRTGGWTLTTQTPGRD